MTRFALALLATLALASPALAQTVVVHDLTVDGDPRPDEYRTVLNAAVETAVVPIRACYTRELATHPGLHGDLRLRLWVSARQVIRVTPETTIGDPALETCAHDRVHEFTLPPQAPEGGAQVRFTMTFTAPATSSTVAPPPTTTAPPQAARVAPPPAHAVTFVIDRLHGGLSQEALTYVFDHAGFDACTTTHTGTVPVTIAITATGHARPTVASGTLRDPVYGRCIAEHITSATYPTDAAATRLRLTITRPRALPLPHGGRGPR